MDRKTHRIRWRWGMFVLFMGALAGINSIAIAQNRGGTFPAAQRAAQLINQMADAVTDVAATDVQRQKIDPLIADARKQLADLTQSLIPQPPVVRRQKLAEFLTDLQQKISACFPQEQAQAFEAKAGDLRQQLLAGLGGRGAAAASQPAGPGFGGQRLGVVIERLRDYLDQINLTDEQKREIETLFSDSRKKLSDLQKDVTDPAAPQPQEQQLVQDLRQELGAILTPQQFTRLRQQIAQNQTAPTTMNPDQPTATAEPAAAMVEPGQTAPDFSLKQLNNSLVQLSRLKGRLVLVVFGSYSSPSFRQRAVALERLNNEFSGRLMVLVIYTRENYPVEEWNIDRNKDQNVAIEQPADMNGRIELARKARADLKLNIPFAMDTMDDSTAKAYGGFTNAAYLIGRDGVVLARQKWFEPYAMRDAINQALRVANQPARPQ